MTSDAIIEESIQGTATVLKNTLQPKNKHKKVYIETYGCHMNFSDSEIVASILKDQNYITTDNEYDADLLFINTCSIRDKAEQTVRNRLNQLKNIKKKNSKVKVGILGCMAERLKTKLLEEEQLVDMVVGPDSYRKLPEMINETNTGQKSVNVFLSKEETYEEIKPVRIETNGVSAFISIMRGCDNMCSFCVVPFTRGRERSRDPFSILAEAKDLFDRGYKEVCLLGQNVDSYSWKNPETNININFADLLSMVAETDQSLRVRFSTSHPKDITNQVLHTIKKHDNICNYIHLPVQSGNSEVLERMNRTYDRAWYIERIKAIWNIIPDCAISTDIITGFCGETEAQHKETLSMMEFVKYDLAYMFKYSERPGTLAEKKYADDIPEQVKSKRLNEIIEKQQKHSEQRNKKHLNEVFLVLIEGVSKRSEEHLFGRNDQNKIVIFPKGKHKRGEYVNVLVNRCTSATLFGDVVYN